MKNIELLDCFQPTQVMLERVNYFPRQLLAVEDMVTERDYFLQKLRRHNRFLHGWGVVCGLEVTAAPTRAALWQVQIGSGYALGPYGDEIYVAEPVLLDLAKCGAGTTTNPCEPDILNVAPGSVGVSTQVFIAIKYAECFARPVRAMPAGCACEDEACEYSRIRDSFQVTCLAELPPQPPPIPHLCGLIAGKQLTPCPPCPTTPWVVLASAILPKVRNASIADGQIDNVTVRRQIYSTAILQEQLIACCCRDNPSDPPTVTTVNVEQGKTYIASGAGGTPPPEWLRIYFSKPLNPATVNDKTILLEVSAAGTGARRIAPDAGDPRYEEASPMAGFRPVEAFRNAPGGFPPGTTKFDYKLIVRGTDADPITDTGGVALDGENTGNPGSDYVCEFSIQFGG